MEVEAPLAVEVPAAPVPENTATQESPPQQEERTFKQADVDEIVQKRLAKEQRRTQKELDSYRIELEKLKAVQEDREKRSQPPQTDQAPKREDFESYEDYLDARAEHRLKQEVAKLDERYRSGQDDVRKSLEAQRMHDAWLQRVAKASEAYPDFEEVVGAPDVAITATMADAIRDSELGPDIAYHLGKHPEEADRISRLSPVAQARAIGRLEATLSKPKEKPVSKAAAPIDAISASGEGGTKSLYDKGLSVDDWVKLRRKG